MVVAVLAAAAGASLSPPPPDHRHHSLLLLNHRLHHQLDHTPSLRRESKLQSGSRVLLHPRVPSPRTFHLLQKTNLATLTIGKSNVHKAVR